MTVGINQLRGREAWNTHRVHWTSTHPILAAAAAVILLPVISLGGLFGLAFGVLAPLLKLCGVG